MKAFESRRIKVQPPLIFFRRLKNQRCWHCGGGGWVHQHLQHFCVQTARKNENIFREIVVPNKIVIRHDCNRYFTATKTIDECEDGAIVSWCQDFDSSDVAIRMASTIVPTNEQVLEKLRAVATKNQVVI